MGIYNLIQSRSNQLAGMEGKGRLPPMMTSETNEAMNGMGMRMERGLGGGIDTGPTKETEIGRRVEARENSHHTLFNALFWFGLNQFGIFKCEIESQQGSIAPEGRFTLNSPG